MRPYIRDVGGGAGGSGEKWDIPYGAGTCGGGEAAFNLSINWCAMGKKGQRVEGDASCPGARIMTSTGCQAHRASVPTSEGPPQPSHRPCHPYCGAIEGAGADDIIERRWAGGGEGDAAASIGRVEAQLAPGGNSRSRRRGERGAGAGRDRVEGWLGEVAFALTQRGFYAADSGPSSTMRTRWTLAATSVADRSAGRWRGARGLHLRLDAMSVPPHKAEFRRAELRTTCFLDVLDPAGGAHSEERASSMFFALAQRAFHVSSWSTVRAGAGARPRQRDDDRRGVRRGREGGGPFEGDRFRGSFQERTRPHPHLLGLGRVLRVHLNDIAGKG
ncbi:hypothetical protein DFH08DRAFT_800208 [Mycena albidolilacea]|uniref:Uncharacterized protein n=1 Tax=Mycena albidolilacea TaxID=1033008 RepID=A0AAD7AJA4_9AGAR|nr:hypothetical protein DFH08DRAFT_800208 [Mycena albidolilacea]